MSTTSALPIDALQKAIDGELPLNAFFGLSTEQIQAMAALGYSMYEQGRTGEAEQVFEGLTAVDSTSYFGFAGLGAIALAKGDLDTAESNLGAALTRQPNDPTVLANLGETLLRKGNAEKAGEYFKRALDLDPEGADPGANRARAILHGMKLVIDELSKNPQ
jgi:Flp pilus assembly protein TadD